MNGIVKLTIRDKSGNIKCSKQMHNEITNAFSDKLNYFINNFDKYNHNLSGSSYAFGVDESYFNGIHLYDDVLIDYKDVKCPVLYGGQTAKSNNENNRYSSVSSHTADDDKISNTWTWSSPEKFTLKSIALHHNDYAENFYPIANKGLPYSSAPNVDNLSYFPYGGQTLKFGNSYLLPAYESESSRYSGYYGSEIQSIGILSKKISTTAIGKFSYGNIQTLYNNEFAVFHSNNLSDLSSESVSNFDIFDDVHLSDFNTAIAKRSFDLSVFKGASHYVDYLAIMPMEDKDYLVSKYDKTINIYEIPREPFAETSIEPSYTFTSSYSMNGGLNDRFVVIIHNIMFLSSANKVVPILIFKDDNVVFCEREVNDNLMKSVSSTKGISGTPKLFNENRLSRCTNDYIYEYGSSFKFREQIWHNNTILNLENPINVENGDSITLTYTIQKNTE